jgi:hypothetical protein
MATLFSMTRDVAGYNGFGLKPTDTAYSVTLSANTDTHFVVPSMSAIGGTNTAINNNPVLIAIFYFTPGAEVWCALNATAIVPAGDTWGATTSEGNPSAWQVNGGDAIHVITAATGVSVGIRLYVIS